MKLDKKTLEYIFSSNLSVTGYVNTPSGGDHVYLELENIEKYRSDYTQFCADHFGLTLEQYKLWMATHGTPRCGEKTKSGKRCKKPCGRVQSHAQEWLAEDGGVCAYHERQLYSQGFKTRL